MKTIYGHTGVGLIKIDFSRGIDGKRVYFYARNKNGNIVSVYSVNDNREVFEGEDWSKLPNETKEWIRDYVAHRHFNDLWKTAGGK